MKYTEHDKQSGRTPEHPDLIKDPSAAYELHSAQTRDDGVTPIRPSAEFPRQGSYTTKDYYALPDDRRFELIDGMLIEMESPSVQHQVILAELAYAIRRCIEEKGLPCKALPAPLDVLLDRDDRTVVQPDLLVLCEDDSYDRVFRGAPRFVAEVLSPSTRARDMIRKRRKYQRAGVREYWIIDPESSLVYVNYFEENEPEEVYPFESIIEIRISNGSCFVDFEEISRQASPYIRCAGHNSELR